MDSEANERLPAYSALSYACHTPLRRATVHQRAPDKHRQTVQSTAIAMIGSAVPPSALRYSSADACVGPSSRVGMALRRMLLGGLTDLPVVLRKRLVVRRRFGDRARRRDEEDDLVLGGVLTSGLRFGTHTVCAVAAQAKRPPRGSIYGTLQGLKYCTRVGL